MDIKLLMKLMEKETSFHIFSTICICEMSHYPWLLLLLLNSRNCLFSKLEKNFHAKKITNNFGFESFRNWSIWKALIVRSLVKLYQFLLRKSFLRKVLPVLWVINPLQPQQQKRTNPKIADSAQTEYCSTFHCSCVRPCVRVSQAWHLTFLTYIKA